MTRANTTRWYSPVGVMVWAGAMCKRTVTFRLSQRIGDCGRRAAVKNFREHCEIEAVMQCTVIYLKAVIAHRYNGCSCTIKEGIQ